jgi:hypothetical protein
MVEKNRAGSGRMRIGFHAFRIAISCPFLQVTGGINDAAAGFHCGTWGSGGLGGACTLVHIRKAPTVDANGPSSGKSGAGASGQSR